MKSVGRDNSLAAIRSRYGIAMINIMKLTPEQAELRRILTQSLLDVVVLLKELEKMTPKADEHGLVMLHVEELQEELQDHQDYIEMLEADLEEQKYERRLLEISRRQ